MTEPTPKPSKRKHRLALCMACPHREAGAIPQVDRCGKCGCFIAAKVIPPGQSCPVGKW